MDERLFLYLNGMNSPFFDQVMYYASEKWFWIPLYVILLLLLYRVYGRKIWAVLLMIAVLITITDQVSVQLFKNLVQRPRPCHEADLLPLIHLVKDKCGGAYGFLSSHAANSSALMVFLTGLLWRRYRAVIFIMPAWVLLVSYSRVYLGVHYPGDVIAGMVVGGIIGFIFYILGRKALRPNNRPYGLTG
jgi:undecaprenyl-diphosphatase